MKTPISVILGRIAVSILTVLVTLVIAAYGVMWILVNGPSPTAKRLFVLSVKETSAGGFLADIYLSESEIEKILGTNAEEDASAKVDTSLIQIPSETEGETGNASGVQPDISDQEPTDTTDDQNNTDVPVSPKENPTDGIEIVQIEGPTYHGKMLIISDPKRVFVGVPDVYGEDASGLTVSKMIEKYDCIAGTNAGGFHDPNGQGTGGIPDGIVMYEGEVLWGGLTSLYSIAGIDADGVLHVGLMNGQTAIERGIQYAASYGPALVMNGTPCNEKASLGGGLNPRTAIGQRADGAILLLVINGRSLGSLGATYDDLVEIMLSYGAVNATNLDGGSSSLMIMDGEYLTNSAYMFGERVVATAILVK